MEKITQKTPFIRTQVRIKRGIYMKLRFVAACFGESVNFTLNRLLEETLENYHDCFPSPIPSETSLVRDTHSAINHEPKQGL